MTPEQFCYWLNGYFEVSELNSLTTAQVQIIKDHLKTVFNKVTPDRNVKTNIMPVEEDDNRWRRYKPKNPYHFNNVHIC